MASHSRAPSLPAPCLEAEVYQALVLGVRDYLGKNGFPGAIIGLSGGIDSALTLCHRGRRAGRRQGARGDDAFPVHGGDQPRRIRARWSACSAYATTKSPSRRRC
jgi:NH3-dependent NAD+ synthetase